MNIQNIIRYIMGQIIKKINSGLNIEHWDIILRHNEFYVLNGFYHVLSISSGLFSFFCIEHKMRIPRWHISDISPWALAKLEVPTIFLKDRKAYFRVESAIPPNMAKNMPD